VSGGIPFGTVGGVRLVVGWSWLLVQPVVALGIFAAIDPGSGSALARTLVAAGGSLLFSASVVAHELGHAVVARRHGIEVERVVVFLLGGYSEMDLDAARPEQEWMVAVAGPISSGLLCVVLAAGAFVAPATGGLDTALGLLAVVNGGVTVLNLLPAFPLDGGRMLRSALVRRGRSPLHAERTATRTGIVLGGAIALGGVVMSLLGTAVSLVVVPVGFLVLILATGSLSTTAAEEI